MTFRAILTTIRHVDQEYSTVGNWALIDGGAPGPIHNIKVSELGDWRYEALVAIHELVEAILCRHRGISEEAVTAFDKEFIAAKVAEHCPCETDGGCNHRRLGKCDTADEPGDSLFCPYRNEHGVASHLEQHLAECLGVVWAEYSAAIDAAMEGK